MGSQSGEIIVVDNQFSTLATALMTVMAVSVVVALETTATSATPAATIATLLEVVVVFASLETKELVVVSLGSGVHVENGQLRNLGLHLRSGLVIVLQTLGVELLVLSGSSGTENAGGLGSLLVQVILKSETNFLDLFDLLGLGLGFPFTSLSAGSFLGLLTGGLGLSLDLISDWLRVVTPVALAMTTLLEVLPALAWLVTLLALKERKTIVVLTFMAMFGVGTTWVVATSARTLGTVLSLGLGVHIFVLATCAAACHWASTLSTATTATSSATASSAATLTSASEASAFSITTRSVAIASTTAASTRSVLPFVGSCLVLLDAVTSLAWLGSLGLLDHNDLLGRLLGRCSLLRLGSCSSGGRLMFVLSICKRSESVHLA